MEQNYPIGELLSKRVANTVGLCDVEINFWRIGYSLSGQAAYCRNGPSVPMDRHNNKGARVKRPVTIAAAATAIVVVGLSGCSSNKSTTSGPGTSSKHGGASVATGGANAAKVTIDGKD
ncbi:MAG: hypothetical protein ACRDU4_16665, partial [Mycobacterium sp.]